MSTKPTPYTIVQVIDGEPTTLATRVKKDAAIKFAIENNADQVLRGGDEVWIAPTPTKKQYNFATRATTANPNAITGRFELATYSKTEGETPYSQRPDAVLRSMLGIKWKELWALGISQKKATEILAAIADGSLNLETYRAGVLAALDLETD